jgi:hypothetical protein
LIIGHLSWECHISLKIVQAVKEWWGNCVTLEKTFMEMDKLKHRDKPKYYALKKLLVIWSLVQSYKNLIQKEVTSYKILNSSIYRVDGIPKAKEWHRINNWVRPFIIWSLIPIGVGVIINKVKSSSRVAWSRVNGGRKEA